MAKKKIKVMLTAFRDGFQCVIGSRVFSKDFLPVVEEAASIGIKHLEAGGGASFQSSIFYTNENSFDVMDSFRKAAGKDAELQTLARGINVVALKSQSKDIIKLHADLFKKHGMTTIRNFDALNDVNNLIWSGQCIKDAGLKHEVTVTMMELPPGCEGAHDAPFYEKVLRGILDAGIPYDSVAFKDASGTSRPQKVFETIKMARHLLGDKVKIVLHSHETAGTGTVSYKAAIDAGVDQLDLSIAPLSGGPCQPDIITMWHCLRGTDYELDIPDINKIIKLEASFKNAMKDYVLPNEATKVEPLIPFFPMPGGALGPNIKMLRDNNLMDKYPEVINAMGETVKKGGFGTSVTPVSQFYFQQAFNNVMFGPWNKIVEGYGNMVLGYFGKTPVPPDAEIVKIASEQLKKEPTTRNPIDINEDKKAKGEIGIPSCEKKLKDNNLPINDENIFIVASCEDKGILFLKGEATVSVEKKVEEKKVEEKKVSTSDTFTVKVNNNSYIVKLDGNTAIVDGQKYDVSIKEGGDVSSGAATTGEGEKVNAPMPGLILRINKKAGDNIKKGETILVMESMKMETPINANKDGVITAIVVKQGQQVQSGQALYVIK